MKQSSRIIEIICKKKSPLAPLYERGEIISSMYISPFIKGGLRGIFQILQKNFKLSIFLISLFFLFTNIVSALEIRSIKLLDSSRASRTSFSSSEKITLYAEVSGTEQFQVPRIYFTFIIYNTVGAQVFKHTGNSIPGTTGVGGSEVCNILISRFYDKPGSYSFEVTAGIAESADFPLQPGTYSVNKKISFEVYSPVIVLSYPANGALDLIDQPLVFRWIGSGASKYKIFVDDDLSFYNALFTAETIDTSYSYPMNPADQRQKLIGGQQYYWKVQGLDIYGNVVAETSSPFSFTLKESAASSSTRDVAISSIYIGNEAMPPQLAVKVEAKNAGGRSESNITFTLYLSGILFGTQKMDLINAGETKVMTFTVEPPELAPDQPLLTSVTHNLADDDMKNNILTVQLALKDGFFTAKFAKILGRITEKESNSKGIENAKVTYSGPTSGETSSLSGGQYKIEELESGTYKLKATHPEYMPEEKTVTVEKGKAYTNIDFELTKRKSPVYTLDDVWDIIKEHLSKNVLNELKGYRISQIKGMNKEEFMDIVSQLKDKKAKIINAEVSY